MLLLTCAIYLECAKLYSFWLKNVILKVSVLFSRLALSTYEASLDGGPDDMTVVDATTLRRQVSSEWIHYLHLVARELIVEPLWVRKHFLNYLSTAHQVEPETPTLGRGEQGASKARDDPVLGHCGFLARQHLGVVATLEPACVSAIAVTEERTISYSMCQMLATRCTQSLREEDLATCA